MVLKKCYLRIHLEYIDSCELKSYRDTDEIFTFKFKKIFEWDGEYFGGAQNYQRQEKYF